MTKPLAVNAWYAYSKMYNFTTGVNIYPKDAIKTKTTETADETKKRESIIAKVDEEANALKGMLWMGYANVGFGVRAPWAVGRFCPGAGVITRKMADRTAVDNYENVNDICTLTTGADAGYNRCYNKHALRYQNRQRRDRKKTTNLKLDKAIAIAIQKEMETAAFKTTGKIASRGIYSNCGESTYKRPSTSTATVAVEFSNEASLDWYSGQAEYDPTTGKQKATGDKTLWPKMMKFTQMVWKNTSKVGFGVKNDQVVAWYCEAKGNVGTAEDFKANVGEPCVGTTVTKKYN